MDTLNKKEKDDNIIVLGIPRGGVITADVVARKISAKYFDIVISRKLTDIDNKEQSIGAIMEVGTTYFDKEIIKELSIPDDYIEKEKAYQIQEIKRRTSLYRIEGLEYKTHGKVAILVDDGAASSTFRSVSQYYQVFDPITDKQVITIMNDRGLL
jgi:putative phosphoribosyl transferase